MSQTLMQLLYLMPAAFLLWRNFYGGGDVSALLVPILIVTAGQLGGGLAWLAVSGEDAPDLIASAPVPAAHVLRAKTEAVLGGIAVVFVPFVVLLAVAAPLAAFVSLIGVVIAAGSATAIQYWFRTQARRSIFRRRQTSSRVATIAEALSSTGWAGTGALAATGTWLAVGRYQYAAGGRPEEEGNSLFIATSSRNLACAISVDTIDQFSTQHWDLPYNSTGGQDQPQLQRQRLRQQRGGSDAPSPRRFGPTHRRGYTVIDLDQTGFAACHLDCRDINIGRTLWRGRTEGQ